METMELVVLSKGEYTNLCIFVGLGWGLWVSTFVAAILIDGIKWTKWANGR